MFRPGWLRRQLYLLWEAGADVIVKRVGNEAWAVRTDTREIIARSKDHGYVLQKAVDYLIDELGGFGTVFLDRGKYYLYNDLVIQRNSAKIRIVGSNVVSDYEYSPRGSEIVTNGYRIIDDGTNWGMVQLVGVTVTTTGEYDKPPVSLGKTLLFLEDVNIRIQHGSTKDYGAHILIGSGGPPGYPVTWRNVAVLDSRRGPQEYLSIFYIWTEGFIWDGGSIVINLPEDIGWLSFLYVVGNQWAVLRNHDVFIGSIGKNKYLRWFIFNVPAILENVEVPSPRHISGWHITSFAQTPKPVKIESVFENEAGPLIVPIIDREKIIPIFGYAYRASGTATLSGDGTTTDFLIGNHGLKIGVTDPSKVAVTCTPTSPDAIAASPCTCYLSDEDGDGVYESIRVKFANPPVSGTNNVKVVWRAEYVG